MALARFAEDHAKGIIEVDINPVFALPDGPGVLTIDATIRMARETKL
jgi:hypothetical protein